MLAGQEKSLGNWRAHMMFRVGENGATRASEGTPKKIAGQVEGHARPDQLVLGERATNQ
jgi:hypothetical protein